MCPSTNADAEQRKFAREVLRKLLRRIADENSEGSQPILVSHAWTDGPMMYLVYAAPPSDITRGLVRDTRESIIDPGPWPDVAEAVRYYYLLDLDERQPWGSFRQPGEPSSILWDGFPLEEGLPERLSDIPETYRHMPGPMRSPLKSERHAVNEPRRYADPS
ncbi:hypothetical protein MSAS_45280 [Mycobacterium saskatchewanense]|uniref:hypothetical protein n=1 Tax=Mycobacterium saskatchewanense TaxID=220927 RepID=UPI000A16BB19|nr:hypothetical protein [Mycobacterium saskatchewanense]BBX65354.1 hypothetical protein MSAS_45280 [Mycobacterium saskatchewanense]